MRSRLRGLLALALGLGMIAGVVALGTSNWQVQAQAVWQRALGLSWSQVAAFLLALTVAQAWRAERLHLEWRVRAGVDWWECFRVVSMHYGLLNLLPMRAGEAGFSWLLWRRWKISPAHSVAALLQWRLQDGWVLLCLSMLVWLPVPPGIGLLASGLLVVATWLAARRRLVLAAWLQQRPGPGAIAALAHALGAALGSGGGGRSAWLCGAGTWTTKIAAQAAMLAWLTPLAVGPAVAGSLAGEWGAALPTQPAAGFGTYEAAVWLGVGLAAPATPAASVLAAALTGHLLAAAYSILLGALFWLGSLRSPQDIRTST